MIEFLSEYGIYGLFIASFLAATVLPLSSEVILLLLMSQNEHLLLLFIVATMGNWLGSLSTYYIGYLGKTEWLKKYFGIKPEKVEAWTTKAKKYGPPFGFFCWTPVVGDLIAAALGFLKVKFIPTAIYMLIGKAFRYAFVIWGASYFFK